MTQSTSICGPGNSPGMGCGLNICVNEEMEIDDFVGFVGLLPSWAGLAGLSTLVRFCVGFCSWERGCTLLEVG